MVAEEAPLIAAGRQALSILFDLAVSRLRERGVAMTYDAAAVSWLLARPEWQASLNPLPTLKGLWHQKVASVIEGLLLCGRLKPGDALWVGMRDPSRASELQFVVNAAAG